MIEMEDWEVGVNMAESGASLVADIGYVDSFDGGDYGNLLTSIGTRFSGNNFPIWDLGGVAMVVVMAE